jgi:hypothetical protein
VNLAKSFKAPADPVRLLSLITSATCCPADPSES